MAQTGPQGLYPPLFPNVSGVPLQEDNGMNQNNNNGINSIPISIPSSSPQQRPGFSNTNPQIGANQLFDDWGRDSVLTQAGIQYGSRFLGQGQTMLTKEANKYFSSLKYYYNVNNSYVINKIKLVLFPLRHKYWKRRIQRQGEGEVYLPPRDDINAPDLYIPTMAFVTYILLIGYVMGTAYKFTPDVLGLTASKGLFLLGFEVLLIKTGFYLLNSLTVPVFDVVSYCGYKYVGIIVTVLGGLLFGHYAFYSLLTLTTGFMALFMVRTLKMAFPEVAAFGNSLNSSVNKRNYFLLGIALFQLIEGYYLSYDISF